MSHKDPYRILPRHSKSELEALRESIKADGLKSPIVVDDDGNIIDGYARRDICRELGIDCYVGADVRAHLSDSEKRALAILLNLPRRSTQPSARQRREYVEILLADNPEQSDQCVGLVVGLDRSTVAKIRARLVKDHKLKPALKTTGKDGKSRMVSSGKRQKAASARLIVKSQKEYERLAPVIRTLKDEPEAKGLIRRPNKLVSVARRKEVLAEVDRAKKLLLPTGIDIRCCDFRKLDIEPGSIDLICTDVVWSNKHRQDWQDLAEFAARWLKPQGLFTSFMGTESLFDFADAMRKHLCHSGQIFAYVMRNTHRTQRQNVCERWRPIPIFSKSEKVDFHMVSNLIDCDGGPEKDYDPWQQPLPVVTELVRRLIPRHRPVLVCDPQVGTGTTAVACAQLGLSFVGCDIDPKKVKIARHRVATEGGDAQGEASAS